MRLKGAASGEPPKKLSQRGPEIWLAPVDRARMLDLREASIAAVDDWKPRREMWRLYSESWAWHGSIEDLLMSWAEDNRRTACQRWAKRAPHGLVRRLWPTFEPFLCDGLRAEQL